MAQWSFPFQDIGGDRVYSDADFAYFFQNLFTNGVFINVGDALQVTALPTPAMKVNVGSGAGNINGRQFMNTATLALDVPVASTTQNRTDSVVMQLDIANRQIQLVYKQGVVTVVQNELIYEIQLAQISVAKNASTITAANITDMRANETLGGYASPFEKVDVSGLEAQYQAMLQALFEQAQANVDANNQAQQTALQTMNAIFQTWLTNLQNQLDDNQAANLQGQINNLAATNDAGITITHSFGGYPSVSVWSWEYGLGLVGLGDEPDGDFGGTNVMSYPSQVEYLDGSSLKVYLPDNIMMTSPTITDQGDGRYLLTEGHRSVGIRVGTDGYKNIP